MVCGKAHFGFGGAVSSVALRVKNLLPLVATLWSPTMALLSWARVPGAPAASSSASSGSAQALDEPRRGGL